MVLALSNLQWLICHKTKPNQTLNFDFVGMHSAAASIWAVTKFSYSSFRCKSFRSVLKSIKVYYIYRISITYITIGEDQMCD